MRLESRASARIYGFGVISLSARGGAPGAAGVGGLRGVRARGRARVRGPPLLAHRAGEPPGGARAPRCACPRGVAHGGGLQHVTVRELEPGADRRGAAGARGPGAAPHAGARAPLSARRPPRRPAPHALLLHGRPGGAHLGRAPSSWSPRPTTTSPTCWRWPTRSSWSCATTTRCWTRSCPHITSRPREVRARTRFVARPLRPRGQPDARAGGRGHADHREGGQRAEGDGGRLPGARLHHARWSSSGSATGRAPSTASSR